jgi:predicted nuclease with TOPRIM domain
MASENVALRKQVQSLEKQKSDLEQDMSKKTIDGMTDLRQKEAKLKTKLQRVTKEKGDLLEGIKELQNEYALREN